MAAAAAPHAEVRRSACPLDCPDSCGLDVTVRDGRVAALEGNRAHAVTAGFMCGKVKHFPELMYGPDRMATPLIRTGPKGAGEFRPASWDEALTLVAGKLAEVKARHGGEAILPACYGGSNGYLTQDCLDLRLFRRLGATEIQRTLCAAPATRVVKQMFGAFPGVAFPDFVHAKLIVLWGVNPAASGVHLAPFVKVARKNGAALVVVDPRRTPFAAQADLHLAVRPGTDVAVALAVANWLFRNGRADERFLADHAADAEEFRRRAAAWDIPAAASVAGIAAADLQRFAELYAAAAPALIRCGWGVERNRNGGSSVAAILALPVVAGKYGVRGGGHTLSNSPLWWKMDADAAIQEPAPKVRTANLARLGRELEERRAPPFRALFVYNCNPVVNCPDQRRLERALRNEELFTVVFDPVLTDSAKFADVALPATTFLEHRELVRGYGAQVLHHYGPAAPPAGEARSNNAVFAELIRRLGLEKPGDVVDDRELARRLLATHPHGAALAELGERDGTASPPELAGRVQFQDFFPATPDGKVRLVPESLDREAPLGLYAFRPEPAGGPLALLSSASTKTINSTLGQLQQGIAEISLHPADAAARGLAAGDEVRVFNATGEVLCRCAVDADLQPGVAYLPKGLWRKHTRNAAVAVAVTPDDLTDLGGGPTYNDARVEVARA